MIQLKDIKLEVMSLFNPMYLNQDNVDEIGFMAIYKDNETGKTINPEKLRDYLIIWTIEYKNSNEITNKEIIYKDNASLGYVIDYCHLKEYLKRFFTSIVINVELTKIGQEG